MMRYLLLLIAVLEVVGCTEGGSNCFSQDLVCNFAQCMHADHVGDTEADKDRCIALAHERAAQK